MAASIGGKSVIAITGAIGRADGLTVAEITRPGVDGHAFREQGKRGAAFQVITTADFADAATAEAELAIYKALQGTLVTVVENDATSHANLCVLSVDLVAKRPVAAIAGGLVADGGGTVLLVCRWVLQPTETS